MIRETSTTSPSRAALGLAISLCVAPVWAQTQSVPGPQHSLQASFDGLPRQDHSVAEGIYLPGAPRPTGPDLKSANVPGTSSPEASLGKDAVTFRQRFAGPASTGFYPADPAIAVGPEHLVVAVNGRIEFRERDGGKVLSSTTPQSFFVLLGALSGMQIYEPSAMYDVWSKRFFMMYSSRNTSGSQRSYAYLAISKTSDPTKGWHTYATGMHLDGRNNTGQYMKGARLGVDNKGIYVVANMHRMSDDAFVGAKIRVLQNKSSLINGPSNIKSWDFKEVTFLNTVAKAYDIMPVKAIGRTPIDNATHFAASASGPASTIYFWTLTKVTNSTTGPVMDTAYVKVANYEAATNLPQNNSLAVIKAPSTRLTNAYVTSTTQGLEIWTSHTVKSKFNTAGIRWYNFKMRKWPTAGTPSLEQSGIIYTASRHYAFPQLAVNRDESVAVVFMSCSSTGFPAVRVAGRRKDRSPNTMYTSAELKAGEAQYWHNLKHTGNTPAVFQGCDTGPDGEIFFIGAYAARNNEWGTYIGSMFAPPVVSPPAYADQEGEYSSNLLGTYREQRMQLMDTNFVGQGTRSFTQMAFRPDYRNHGTTGAVGRNWDLRVQAFETSVCTYDTQFNNNHQGTPQEVFDAQLVLPAVTGTPASRPAEFDGFRVPFKAPWAYSGAADRALGFDFSFKNGSLQALSPWGSQANYRLDAARARTEVTAPTLISGRNCVDPSVNAAGYLAPQIRTYAAYTGEASTSNKVSVSLNGLTRKGGNAFYALGFKPINPGVQLNACNPLMMDPMLVLAVPPSPADGSFELDLGMIPYKPMYAGLAVYAQAGWANTKDGSLMLSRMGTGKVLPQPETPTLFSVAQHGVVSKSGRISGSGLDNPIRKYWQ